MMNLLLPLANESPKWKFAGTVVWGLLISIFYVAVQTAVVFIYSHIIYADISAEQLNKIQYNGTVLSFATLATLVICGLLVIGIVKLKKNSNLKQYLAINTISVFEIKVWGVVVIVLVALIDLLSYTLGRPIVVEFMTTVYNSTSHHWLLLLAVVIAAPVFEELFFRGFLLSGFTSTFLGPIGAIILTSLAWTVIHLQYDLYGMATIFVTGLVFGVARLKTNSILTTILMHSIMNLIASIETSVYVALHS